MRIVEGTPRSDNGFLDARGRPRVQTINDEPSMTVQSDHQLSDINFIVRRATALGVVESLNRAEGQFRDISEFTDLADALRGARAAEDFFMTLPSKVRQLFDHDVAVFLDTAHDEDKRDALIEAGVIPRPAEAPSGASESASGGAGSGSAPAESGGAPASS